MRLGTCMETEAISVGIASEATIVSTQIQRLRALWRSRAEYSAARAAPLSNSVITRTYNIQVSIEGAVLFRFALEQPAHATNLFGTEVLVGYEPRK